MEETLFNVNEFFLMCLGIQGLRERIISNLVTEQRDFSMAFVMERTYERVQQVMVQLSRKFQLVAVRVLYMNLSN